VDDKQYDNKTFMENPGLWPHWPVLPLKKYTQGELQVACLIDGPTKPTIILKGMYDLTKGPLDEQEHKVYMNLDELLADGWKVD
jgi:hypothetical protein